MKETFFLQVTPGLEDIAKRELEVKFQSLFPLEQIPVCHMERGGFSIELEVTKGFALNYWLKIPNRILLRFAHFKCRDLPKLFNKIKKMQWSPYFAGQDYTIKVSAHNSRLFDDRKISKSIKDGLAEYVKRQVPGKKSSEAVQAFSKWSLFCRFEEDWCTISIDTSGERLGLRGIKTHIGLAPLRENLAAALYLYTLNLSPNKEDILNPLAPLFIFDPFAGSGTIIQESFLFFEPNTSRRYAFEYFPLTTKNTSGSNKPTPLKLDIPFLSLANDKNSNQLAALKANYNAASMNLEQNKVALGDSMSEEHLKKELLPLLGKAESFDTWIITNPPFGKRLKSPGALKDLLDHFFSLHKWKQVGVLLPKGPALLADEYTCLGKLEFSHGGEDVCYSLWKR
jgi:putative N6-adenine-specific DNA methylase